MASISSSVISESLSFFLLSPGLHRHLLTSTTDKSGRKFAPKVPVRRGGPAAATPAASATRKPDTDAQTQPAAGERTPPPSQQQPTTEDNEVATTSPSHTRAAAVRPPSSPSRQHPRPSSRDKQAVPIPVPARGRDSSTATSPPPPSTARTTSLQKTPTATTRPSPTKPSTPQVSQPPQVDGAGSDKRSLDGQQRPDRSGASTTRSRGTTEPSVPPDDNDADVRPAKRIRTTGPATRTLSSQADRRTSETEQRNPTEEPSRKRSSGANPDKTHAKRRKSAADAADEVVADAVQEKTPQRRKREKTPENAGSIEIMSGVVKMSDLCKDIRIGKKSRREIELQNMDGEETARKRKEKEERRREEGTAEQRNESADTQATAAAETHDSAAAAAGGPKMRIVNGEIVLDAASLQIDRHADAAREMDNMEAVEENPLTRKINSSSFGKRAKAESWDGELTDLFYRGLRMFGTDFMMISKMFPGRTRRHIKLKFSNEERRHPERIKEALLGPRESVTLEDYSHMTNTLFDDPRVVEQELEEEKKKIEEQHAQEKEAREELLRHPEGEPNVLPSIENEDKEKDKDKDTDNNTKRPRNNQKKNANAKPGGGTEEILGSIDD